MPCFSVSSCRAEPTEDGKCKACEEWIRFKREQLFTWVVAWPERVKHNSPPGWDSRRETGGLEDIAVRAHSCDLGLRGSIPKYTLMCPPMDYGPDVLWKKDLSMKISIYAAMPGSITEARWRLTLPLDMVLHFPNGFDHWCNEDVRLHGVLTIINERWEWKKGIQYEWREAEGDRVGSQGKKLFPPWKWQAKLTYGARPDAEIWMIGVYCGVFLTDKEMLVQRRIKMKKKRKKALTLRVVDSSATETSNSSQSSDDYLPSR